MSLFPYSNNVCWDNLVQGSGNFTPPPPPVCTTCPITGWSNTTGTPNNNGTCTPTDDILPATITVNHLSCGSITGDGKFSVVFNSQTYGPFNYSSGITTTVNLNLPYGTSSSSQVNVVDSDFPCNIQHGLTVPGGQFNGVPAPIAVASASGVTSFCQGGSVTLNAQTGTGYSYQWRLNGNNIGGATSSSYVANASGSYSVAVTSLGCTVVSNAVNVTVNPLPATPVINASATSICQGEVAVLSTNAVGGPTNTTSFINYGASGSPVTCDCPAGYVAVGYEGHTGSWLDHFRILCRQLNANGTVSGSTVSTAMNGQSFGGGYNGPYVFGGNTVMTGMSAIASPSGYFGGVTGYGQSPAYILANGNNASSPVTLGTMQGGWLSGGIGGLTVPDGNVVVGMQGWSGSFYTGGVALRYKPISSFFNTVAWSNNATTGSINVTSTGTYTVTVTDGNGCSATSAPTTVTVHNLPSASIAASGPTSVCPGSGVSMTADASGIITGYQWMNNGNPVQGATSISYTATTSGDYVVAATDINGCYTTSNVLTIDVSDVTAPTAVCQNVTVALDANGQGSITAAQLNGGSSDNCGNVFFSASQTSFDCSNLGANPVVLTVNDGNGNSSNCTAVVTVVDNTNPVITCAANVVVACDASTAPANTGSATATDNCGATVSYSDVSSQDANANNSGHYNYTITRTWTAIDASNNSVSCVQTITVEDVVAPTITSCPSSVTVNCQDATTVATLGTATADDACSPVAVSHNDNSTQSANVNDAAHYNYTITRTWTATDVTGNSSSCTQVITVQDVTAPSVTCPANATVSCKTSVSDNGSATGSDNCSSVAISHSDNSSQDANPANAGHYSYTITRTWTATDVTGNSSNCAQVITVNALNNAAIAVNPVNTINANHPNHTIYIGYGPQSVTLTASALGGVGAHSYSWAPTTGVANPNSASTSVAPTTTTTYTVTITDGTGCSITKSVTINVVDVRCGNNNNKVKVCHIPPGNNSNPQNLCIASSAVATHLAHGCKLGDCPGAKNGSYEEEDEHMGGLVVNEVKVYPNPNNGSFTIELPTGMEQASIAVLDMAGKVIVKQVANGSKVQVDLGSVARAMYMVNVTNGSEVFRTKVSVQ